MTNPKFHLALVCSALLLSGFTVTILSGCAEEEPPPVVVKPPPPPAPVEKPKAHAVADLMAENNIDPRIRMTEDQAPETTEDRIAVLKFFDAFARGNEKGLSDYLSPPDRFALEQMVKSGQFTSMASKIGSIDIQTGDGPDDKTCALAVFQVNLTEFEPQLWSFKPEGETYMFEAEPCPPGMIEKLSGNNWIGAWFDVIKRETERAAQADEVIVIQKRVIDNSERSTVNPGEGTPDTGSPGPAPNAPGDPGKRRPLEEPVEEPGRLPG